MNDASERRLAARAIARGRVQGVFYRDTVRRAALEHEVRGSAVNLPDGSVELLLEGDRTTIDAVLDVAREGSRGAVVESLSVEWIEPSGAQSFTIG
ncbi:MAG: acylphosphatase [Thermoleophilia bacterium]|nr:acylphosphatase [Thermoleophilia bacterium]